MSQWAYDFIEDCFFDLKKSQEIIQSKLLQRLKLGLSILAVEENAEFREDINNCVIELFEKELDKQNGLYESFSNKLKSLIGCIEGD